MRIVLFALIILISSCSSRKITSGAKYPHWYLNPNQGGDANFYATGTGIGKKAAINDALGSLARQVKSVISSKFKEEVSSMNSFEDSKTFASIELESQNIELSGYKVLKSHQMENMDFLVLLKLPRSTLIKLYQSKEEESIASLRRVLSGSPFNLLKQQSQLEKDFQDLRQTLSILSSLGRDTTSDLQQFLLLKQEAATAKEKITFSFHEQGSGVGEATRLLKKVVVKEGFSVANKRNAVFSFHVTVSSFPRMSGDLFLVKQIMEVSLRDGTGKLLGSEKFEEIGSSLTSFSDAQQGIGVELKKRLGKSGLRLFL